MPPTQSIQLESIVADWPKCPCGYEPLAARIMSRAGLTAFPRAEVFWYLVSAAMRVDAAHRLIEHARDRLDHYSPSSDWSEPLDLTSDVQLAVVALHRSLQMARPSSGSSLPTGWPKRVAWPRRLERKRVAIRQLRNAHEHIEDRAAGKLGPSGKVNIQEAHSFFTASRYGKELLEHRRIRYRQWKLSVDDEVTRLLMELREHLWNVWLQLESRHKSG